MRGANGSRPWTPVEIASLADAARSGGSVAVWARANNRTLSAVYSFCAERGIRSSCKPEAWTDEIIQQATALRAGGATFRQIAKIIGKSRTAVSTWFSKRGHPDSNPPHRKPPTQTKTRQRNCLSCGKRFQSWGPGNRMCSYCRSGHISLAAGHYAI